MSNPLPSFHRDGDHPAAGWIFVFGSNLAGRHGAGAAKAARDHYGAQYGVGAGRTGRAYAIPTKDGRSGGSLSRPSEILPLPVVQRHIAQFVEHARAHPEERFFVTRVGCGLAGFKDDQIGPAFAAAPANCSLPEEWKRYVSAARASVTI